MSAFIMKSFSAFLLALAFSLTATASEFNGGRTVPVHRFTPVDRDGDKVSVRERMPAAMSQEKTCAQCHDVDKMRGGSHFRSGCTNDVENKVNREPWFLCSSNAALRTVSLADRGGLTAWEWTKTFGWAFPGGGLASCPKAMAEAAGARQRWFVTGALEMNCLACHSQDDYDVSEWAKQVLRENWGGAAIAAAGFARVDGMNERLDASWDSHIAENPDDHLFKVPENVSYDPAKFDDKGAPRSVWASRKTKTALHAIPPPKQA
jgi:mono/diheme cytochrome c family protein